MNQFVSGPFVHSSFLFSGGGGSLILGWAIINFPYLQGGLLPEVERIME